MKIFHQLRTSLLPNAGLHAKAKVELKNEQREKESNLEENRKDSRRWSNAYKWKFLGRIRHNLNLRKMICSIELI